MAPGLLSPWRKMLLDPPPPESARLPPPQELDHIVAPSMADVSRTVNDWLTELQQAVARNDLVLGNLNEGLLALDEAGRILLINTALRKQLQISSDSYLMRPYVEAVRIPRVVQLIDGILADRTARDESIDLGTPRRHLRLLGSPLPLGSDRSGVILTVLDNTLLQQSELARRDFIAGASHELKTPLAAIRAYAETLETAIVDDPHAAPRFLSSILQQADRMNHLVTSMLQLARAESGAVQLRKEQVDVAAALQPCIDAADGIARSKGVELETQLPAERILVSADYDAFQTIAGNLLSNAVRYTGQGGKVSVEVVHEGRHVLLRVSDTGIGIAQEDRDRIFERFYRVQKDRAAESGGTGLGLAIVKQLVTAMGGEIGVDSRLGHGACFEVRLPAVGFTQSS
ncbi:MAG: ATP-binding protein [Pirellulales bacterium]